MASIRTTDATTGARTTMQQVTIDEARQRLGDLIDSAARGDEVVITRDERPVAKLVPFPAVTVRPRFGRAKGLIEMSDDFDAPLDDFAEYTK